MISDKFLYTLFLADNALILGHRNSEWTGHGPNLEQDIAISNIALDLVGQARNLYQYAAEQYNNYRDELSGLITSPAFNQVQGPIDEDDLAYLRDVNEFRNNLLVEQPNGDWAKTILRQFLFSCYQQLLYERMKQSADLQLAAIAEKSLKEVLYHVRWSGEWVIRLGDGTEESKRRMQEAIASLWKFTGELFIAASFEKALASAPTAPAASTGAPGSPMETSLAGLVPAPESLKETWLEKVAGTFRLATLDMPANSWMQQGGKDCIHTEHLGFLLAEMQYLQRAYPGSEW
ncbi:1,2-phenylacetyl-CoA epoxidase subunit PaaC [Flavihumibacter stibioxidans]|uniref:Phenylacetate-CoA oxygenase subunit PaaI n=1 Tax=Flavihumibacter stibioxidans TaxID=1834163 RepID=A0ABR7M9R9_9BACT|nr:1,2-phenylacetyl-CoA epoxidase subunit PaaC [Flavihumibacter stibioxidans]MBC6491775.1 phenylacetate-CoA oxygenase subunit PaaI [Flavihumibacter stibioxidans]